MTVPKWLLATPMLLALPATSVDARVSRDFDNPAWILGQVVYFAARCPHLRTERVQEMIGLYCPHYDIAPADCESWKAQTFKAKADAGANSLKAEFKNADDAHICRAALDRYGPNGSFMPGMLRLRR